MRISRCLALTVPLLLASTFGCSSPPREKPPFPIVELRGEPAELGTQHGQLLGAQIRGLNVTYLRQIVPNYDRASQAALAFSPLIGERHRQEIEALSRSSGLELTDSMLAQCFLDLDAMAACSTITLPAAASPDGVARFARNLDFPARGVADKGSVVLVFHPKDKNTFVAVTWPGLVGVLSGMNEHGLTLASMEITRARRKITAMPYMLLYRTLLEDCRTVDEAIALLEKTPRQTANNLMLMDASGARAVVEITPDKITVRRADDKHPLVSTNHHRGEDLTTHGKCFRYDKLMDSGDEQFGKIGAEQLQSMLAAVQQGDDTIQSMIFEPRNRVMYLSVGAKSANRPFHRVDLKRYLE